LDISASFPRAASYSAFRLPTGRLVREPPDAESSFPYSERHLQCVWFDPSFRPDPLHSSAGEEIAVEDPGRWNLEAGPDFLDATLMIGPERRRIRGDVELHVRPSDWHAHGHADDPAYSRVVAHVSYFPGVLPTDALPRGAVQISLRDSLRTQRSFSFESVDVTAYPYASRPATASPCAEALAICPPQDRMALLDSAGEERLRVKSCRLESAIKERGLHQAFYEEIMCSLGYKHNRQPFRQLAGVVTLDSLHEESDGDTHRAYAFLLAMAGLLPTKTPPRWDSESRTFVRSLWDPWWKLQSRWESRRLPPGSWKLSALRPPNHPIRRLAAAAVLFGDKRDRVAEFRSLNTADPESWFKRATALLEEPVMEHWRRRLSLGGKLQPADTALLGPGRVAAILSNVVIPFLAATGVKIAPLLNFLPAEEDNNLIRQTAFALFGRDHNPALYQTGLRQQGLLQIFHDFCLNNRSACRNCELIRLLAGETEVRGRTSEV
jgi:hypothetical protein